MIELTYVQAILGGIGCTMLGVMVGLSMVAGDADRRAMILAVETNVLSVARIR